MIKHVVPCGQSIVSYSTKPYKALAVPFDTPVVITDFIQLRSDEKPMGQTEVRLWRDATNLHLDVICFEPAPEQVVAGNIQDCKDLWAGDLIEIFFGAVEPVPWQLQLAVGAGGGRFDSQGRYDLWQANAVCNSDGWRVEVEIPLGFLRFNNHCTGFNICRQSLTRGELSTWMGLEVGFHETENYGELLFCDYDVAFEAKVGLAPAEKLTRETFEAEITQRFVSAEHVVHGPYLSNPDEHGMTITWATAGMSGALLEYREKQSSEWLVFPINHTNGILQRNTKLHVAHLTGLKAGTTYEYRLVNWAPLLTKRSVWPQETPFSFRTFDVSKKAFSFAVCSDIHSNAMVIEKLMKLPDVQQTDFFANLGDMLSNMSGPSAYYDGYLDVQTQQYATRKPLVFVRGNHEQIGLFAADYFQMMGHPSGKTYYAFRQGSVCFIALDTGNDRADDETDIFRNTGMIEEERKWLQGVVDSEMYRTATFRVAFLHMPPYHNDKYGTSAGLKLLDGVFKDAPLHLLLSGHVHRYFKIKPFSGQCTDEHDKPLFANTPVLPFMVVANNTRTTVVVKATPVTLDLRVIDVDGKIIDEIVILPDSSSR